MGAVPKSSSSQHAGVRVEACESCKRYVKSIDLTVDARRVPEIDDPGGALAGPVGDIPGVSAPRARFRGAVRPATTAAV